MKKILTVILFMMICNLCFSQKSVMDKGFKNTITNKEMAVMVINRKTNVLNQSLTQKVSDILKNVKGFNTNSSFFNTKFINDGSFEKLFNSDRYRIKKLRLIDNLDYICLGKYQINNFTKNDLDCLVADITLQLNIIDVRSGAVVDSRTYNERGMGINRNEAELNANNKLLLQLN